MCCSFFCMTTNMTRGEPTVHQDGLLWKLVRASMTIVGLIPPVYENGELLIDGGYLNNMPVDVMRGLGVDTVSWLLVSVKPILAQTAQTLSSSTSLIATSLEESHIHPLSWASIGRYVLRARGLGATALVRCSIHASGRRAVVGCCR